MIQAKRISDLTEGELAATVQWLEQDTSMNIFIPLLMGREEDLIESILRNDEDDLRKKGEIKGIRSILAIHDLCMDELERRRDEEAVSAITS